jgi:hypothetical protein
LIGKSFHREDLWGLIGLGIKIRLRSIKQGLKLPVTPNPLLPLFPRKRFKFVDEDAVRQRVLASATESKPDAPYHIRFTGCVAMTIGYQVSLKR